MRMPANPSTTGGSEADVHDAHIVDNIVIWLISFLIPYFCLISSELH